MGKFDFKIPIKYGLIVLVITIINRVFFYVAHKWPASLWMDIIGIIDFGAILFLIVWSGISYRKSHANVITFLHAFWVVYIVILFNVAGSIVSEVIVETDMGFKKEITLSMREELLPLKKNKQNLNSYKAEEHYKERGIFEPLVPTIIALIILLIFLAIVAAIIALFIKRKPSDVLPSGVIIE